MRPRWGARLAIATALAVGAALPHAPLAAGAGQQASAQPPPQGIAPEALAQIEALLREKDSRSLVEQKIDSQLLYELRRATSQPVALGVQNIETDVPYAPDGHAVVDVTARVTDTLMERLTALGIEVLSSNRDQMALRAHIAIDQVQTLAALPEVSFVQPRQDARTTRLGPARHKARRAGRESLIRSLSQALDGTAQPNVLVTNTGQGSESSEGDVAHLAFAARTAFGADGTGVKIGVLSDGVVNLATSQASGDLGPVTVLPGQTGTGDEGTAILEHHP